MMVFRARGKAISIGVRGRCDYMPAQRIDRCKLLENRDFRGVDRRPILQLVVNNEGDTFIVPELLVTYAVNLRVRIGPDTHLVNARMIGNTAATHLGLDKKMHVMPVHRCRAVDHYCGIGLVFERVAMHGVCECDGNVIPGRTEDGSETELEFATGHDFGTED